MVRVGWRGKKDESKEVLELVEFRRLNADELADVRTDAFALEERAYRISKDVWGKTPTRGRLPAGVEPTGLGVLGPRQPDARTGRAVAGSADHDLRSAPPCRG